MRMARTLFLSLLSLSVSGCGLLLGLPRIESNDVPKVVQEIAKSDASICAWIGGRGGGGAGVVAPGASVPVIPTGAGYGSGEILLGRVNSDNTELNIKNGECTIKRGRTEDTEESE